MSPPTPPPPAVALAPLRAELLRRARADADRMCRDAEATAVGAVAAAEARGAEILAAAVARGEADAAEIRAARRSRVRHGIRARELAAQRAVYEDVTRRVTEAVCAWRDEPGYPRLRERLADRARERLGAAAEITEAPGGGIVARGAGRRLDYSLAGFAARAVEGLGDTIVGLWQP